MINALKDPQFPKGSDALAQLDYSQSISRSLLLAGLLPGGWHCSFKYSIILIAVKSFTHSFYTGMQRICIACLNNKKFR